MLLKPNMNWIANQGKELPTVMANFSVEREFVQFDFYVEEPLNCFRAEVMEDAGHSWEDSCVEVFLQNPANANEYFNFEVTSRGYLLAAHGTGRENRTVLGEAQLALIQRTKQLASIIGEFISWGISLRIPASLFGISSFEGVNLRGNMYKCADKANTPHYLSAFPIDTEKPDFHRPEFFQELQAEARPQDVDRHPLQQAFRRTEPVHARIGPPGARHVRVPAGGVCGRKA